MGGLPPQLAEIKLAEDLEKYKDKYHPMFSAAKAAAKTHGWCFVTVSEDVITETRVDNANFLYRYVPYPREADAEAAVLTFMEERGGDVTGKEIFAHFDPAPSSPSNFPDVFWRMVANKVLYTDWDMKITVHSLFRLQP